MPDSLASPGTAVLVMSGRCARLSRRNLDAMITSLMLPVTLLLLFVYLFGGALDPTGGYLTYVVPGVLLLCAGFGAAGTAVTVCQDLTGGIIDRFRTLDLGAGSLLFGHVVASLARNLVSTGLVLAVAFAIGFRPHATALRWLAAAGVLIVFVAAVSLFAAMFGVLAGSPEAANGFTFLLMFITYPSSAFVPIATMPSWLQGFAHNQPVTPVIESLRGLLLDGSAAGASLGSNVARALLWSVGIAVLAMVVSAGAFRRRSR